MIIITHHDCISYAAECTEWGFPTDSKCGATNMIPHYQIPSEREVKAKRKKRQQPTGFLRFNL